MHQDRYANERTNGIVSNLVEAQGELGNGDGRRTVRIDMGEDVSISGDWVEFDERMGTITVFSKDDDGVRIDRAPLHACRNVSVSDGGTMPTHVAPSERTAIAHAILVIDTVERFGPGWTYETLGDRDFPERHAFQNLDRDARNALVDPLVPSMLGRLKEDARGLLDDITIEEATHRILAEHDGSLFAGGGQDEYDRNASAALKAVSPQRPEPMSMLLTDRVDHGTLERLPDDRRDVVQTEMFRIMLREAIEAAYEPYIPLDGYRTRLLSHLRVG